MKQIIAILLFLTVLTACTGNKTDRTISDSDLQQIVKSVITDDRFLLLDKEDIEFVLSVSPNEYERAWVWLDENGSTIDEIAIFAVRKEQADALYQKLEQYVTDSKADKKEWLESYNPSEAIKLQNGRLFRYGNCMGYVFLSENDQAEFFEKFNEFYKAQE